MIFIYILLSLFFIYLSFKKYKKYINILSLYIFIWLLNVILYEIKLVYYNSLTIKTWIILFLNILIFSIGCLFPKNKKIFLFRKININEKQLYKYIVITSLVSSIAIIFNLFLLIDRYGWNLFSATTYIYGDNLNGVGVKTIPYLGSLSLLALLLSSVYLINFGFKKMLICPYVLVLLDILPTGSRGNLVLAIILTVIPILFIKNDSLDKIINIKTIKKIMISLCVFFAIFYTLFTYNRRPALSSLEYASDTMITLESKIPVFYKTYVYFTSPIGVLNEYLKNPRYIFGINSFSVERNFLNKMGINVKYEHTQPAYDIPIRTNVGTWLKDFYEDFTIVGMIIVIFIFGYIFDFLNENNKNNIYSQILFNFIGMLIYLSWFYFYLRQGNVTIIICLIILFGFLKSNFNQTIKSFRK